MIGGKYPIRRRSLETLGAFFDIRLRLSFSGSINDRIETDRAASFSSDFSSDSSLSSPAGDFVSISVDNGAMSGWDTGERIKANRISHSGIICVIDGPLLIGDWLVINAIGWGKTLDPRIF